MRVDLEELTKSTLPDYDLKEALESHLTLGGVTYIKEKQEQRVAGPVSYTHLTLPTIYPV